MASRLLLMQSGGPTAVINASLVGAIETAVASGKFEQIIGARNGVDGILNERFIDLAAQPAGLLSRLRRTPSSGLGTTRTKLDDDMAETALEILSRHGISHVGVIGGNDSADTAQRLGLAARAKGQPLGVISIP
ncbi:MAG TPA: 6-phosphofructokinase, partial [Thermomicrobiaceae bacterium]|nr:6-phosphofructokinase [Thermomicrobiaceae bacterium]